MADSKSLTGHNRIYSLDYLRGYAAALIMVYHYMSWSETDTFFHFFLGKIGFYGVEIFYILSGYTLAHVYQSKDFKSIKELRKFFIKRVFRIFPLLWLVVFATIILRSEGVPEIDVLILNFTGAFSVYRIDEYIALGSWSIGNELFFYLLFPVLMIVRKRYHVILLSIAVFGCYLIFLLPNFGPLLIEEFKWKEYINPLNHLAFFYAGILLYRNKLIIPKPYSVLVILGVLIMLTLIPFVHRNDVVFGFDRIYHSLGVFAIVVALISIPRYNSEKAHSLSEHLGKVSYSVYLLHPLVWGGLGFVINKFNVNDMAYVNQFRIVLAIILTIISSSLVYRWIEMRFMSIGKTIASK